jgi:cysteine dioxygenase
MPGQAAKTNHSEREDSTGQIMAHGLDDLFQFLDQRRDRPSLAELAARLAQLDLSGDRLERFFFFSDSHYQRNLVKAASNYHVWVMCWKAGQRSPIHDHGASICAVRVLHGTATVTHFAWSASGDVLATHSEEVAVGGIMGTQDGDLHQVSNLQGAGKELITLHVYTPPLLRMGTYSMLDATRSVDVWTECIEGAGI